MDSGIRTETSTWEAAATCARKNTNLRASNKTSPQKKGEPLLVKMDEGPLKGDPTKFAGLKPAFSKDGTITAANASSINDGASALVLASERAVKERKLE